MSSHQSSEKRFPPIEEEELVCVECGSEVGVTGYNPSVDGPYRCMYCAGGRWPDPGDYEPDWDDWYERPMYTDLMGNKDD